MTSLDQVIPGRIFVYAGCVYFITAVEKWIPIKKERASGLYVYTLPKVAFFTDGIDFSFNWRSVNAVEWISQ